MKTFITTALVVAALAAFGGRAEARDRCGGGHHHGGHHHGGHHGGHYGGHHYGGHHYGGHYHGCSSIGIGFGSYYGSSFYGSPYYGSGYYGSPYYYSRPAYYSYGYAPRYYSYRSYPVSYSTRSNGYYTTARGSTTSANVQVALARQGYYHGNIDGVIGSQSRNAIRRYQASRGLVVTGAIDYSLLRTLGLI